MMATETPTITTEWALVPYAMSHIHEVLRDQSQNFH